MASLPSVAVSGTLRLEPDIKIHPNTSVAADKSTSITYQKGQRISHNGIAEPIGKLDSREALSMIKESTNVEQSFYMPLLQGCIEKNSVAETQIIHAHIIKTETYKDYYVMTFLVNVYAKCRAMEDARRVFDALTLKNVVAWTSLMTGYVQNSLPEIAIQVFNEMLEAGAYPTNYTFAVVLNASSSLQSIRLGKQFHANIIKYQLDNDTSVGNSLSSFYSKCKSLKSAVEAFKRIKEKNVISWSTVISACGENGDEAMGFRFFTEMLCEDIEPNEFSLTSVLSLCAVMLSLDVGAQIHSLSIKLGYESNLRVTNSVLYLYLKCGCITEARRLFDRMDSMSLVTWNTMIAGYAQTMDLANDNLLAHCRGKEALNTFLKLNRSGRKPDLFTFSSILTVCSRLVALEQGEQIHAQTIKTGFLSDVVVGTSLINMYSRCGSIDKASKAFVEMSIRTLISWTSMITSYAQHGRSQQVLQLFEDMRLSGVRPNQITFVGVLAACSHAGMVDEGLNYFKLMQKEYKITPVMDHYACLIDMFVRSGRIEEAFDFVKQMNFEPNEFIWSLLITGCKTHGNKELGFFAAEQLLKLKPKDTETYAVLLNMYISAERWQDVSRVRKLMKEEKVGKLNDWSWISIKDKVYSFKTSDNSHPRQAEMNKLLDELLEKAKRFGYESPESFEETDEEDEGKTSASTVYHSEKLAIAFGLLSTSYAAPIRVVKSVTMCRDCHDFIEVVSLLTSREIIVRDKKRLHRFVDGHCSCGDVGTLL
ncbi:putative pentatricopeptide repeat-containing protein At5g52630 [Tripterygium wilfordii]|uniref:putative pentatricopeptide repeat-containing protein At5g52630 n=1 Tax=Tripterygium wilfordii TaxID=458696 RepID=UPI0018F85CB0|nr:putative pentatricopeptide repeat-containing protein At5g52630 [Tripterygium wilfordii]